MSKKDNSRTLPKFQRMFQFDENLSEPTLLLSGAGNFFHTIPKGQIISKRLFLVEDSSKKRTKTRRILVKTNSFVRFLEESSA